MAEYIDLERAMVDGRVADLVTGGGQMSGDPGDSSVNGDPGSTPGFGTPPGQMSGALRPGAGRVSLRFHLRADLAQLWRVDQPTSSVPAAKQRRHDEPVASRCTRTRSITAARASPCSEALDALHRYPWPGDGRELEHAIER